MEKKKKGKITEKELKEKRRKNRDGWPAVPLLASLRGLTTESQTPQ